MKATRAVQYAPVVRDTLIQPNMNCSRLRGVEGESRDPFSLNNDPLGTGTHCKYKTGLKRVGHSNVAGPTEVCKPNQEKAPARTANPHLCVEIFHIHFGQSLDTVRSRASREDGNGRP